MIIIKKLIYPITPLDKRIIILIDTIKRKGGVVSTSQLSGKDGTNFSGGTLSAIIKSAKIYSFIENVGKKLQLTEMGKEYLDSDSDEEKKKVLIKAFLQVDVFNKFLKDRMYMPAKFGDLKKILTSEYGIPDKDSGIVASVFRTSLEELKVSFQAIQKIAKSKGELEEQKITSTQPPIHIESNNFVSASKLAYAISYIEMSSQMDKDHIKKILDNMIKQSKDFKELNRELETAKDLTGYTDEKKQLKFMKDKFRSAFERDIGIDNLSEVIGSKITEKFAKPKVEWKKIESKKENKSAEGESAEDETG